MAATTVTVSESACSSSLWTAWSSCSAPGTETDSGLCASQRPNMTGLYHAVVRRRSESPFEADAGHRSPVGHVVFALEAELDRRAGSRLEHGRAADGGAEEG